MSAPAKQPALIPSVNKINYIDHIKVVLTILVILHHTFITYGAPGGWYYSEKTQLEGAKIPMTMFVAVNQSFFMGMFFFLSALFIPTSFDKKGGGKFLIDRLLRLGIPLIFYSFVLSPFLSYMTYNFTGTHPSVSYGRYLAGFDGWINFGVLWFVAALLLFTFAYAIWRMFFRTDVKVMPVPDVSRILFIALAVGVITYWVRIIYPVGRVFEPLGFQFGHFPQYISMFVFGLIASRSKWLNEAGYKTGKTLAIVAICLVFIGMPLFFVVRAWLKFPIEQFNVGGQWPSLWYAVWEQLLGFSMVAALLCIGKSKWNGPSVFFSKLSRSTFAVYIFHPLILIALSVALHGWAIEPAIKLLVVGPIAVIGSFLLGMLLVKIPRVNRII